MHDTVKYNHAEKETKAIKQCNTAPSSYVYVQASDNTRTFAELKPTFFKLTGMFPGTKAMSVGFKRR